VQAYIREEEALTMSTDASMEAAIGITQRANADSLSRRNRYIFVGINLYFIVLLCFFHLNRNNHLFDWVKFIEFQGARPFQLRILPFLIGHWINSFHPLNASGLRKLFFIMDIVSISVCCLMIFKTVKIIYNSRISLYLAFFLFWWQTFSTFVTSHIHDYYYPYDSVSMAVSAVAIYLICKKSSILKLAAVVFVGMLNRETAIVIPFLYLAFNFPERKRIYKEFFSLLLVGIAVKAAITVYFGAASDSVSIWGEPGMLRIFYNFSFLLLQQKYLITLNFLFAFGGMWIFLFLSGKMDSSCKRMMYCLIPYCIGMVFVGNLSEIRIFCEFIPLLTVSLIGKFQFVDAVRGTR
jgi:hypothetical protein